jgi:hypothetical protein
VSCVHCGQQPSVWNEEGVAQAAVSIDEDEAARLGALLAPRPARKPRLSFLGLHSSD